MTFLNFFEWSMMGDNPSSFRWCLKPNRKFNEIFFCHFITKNHAPSSIPTIRSSEFTARTIRGNPSEDTAQPWRYWHSLHAKSNFSLIGQLRYILPNSLLKCAIVFGRRVNHGIYRNSPCSRRVASNQRRPEPSRPLVMRRDHPSTHQVTPSHTECQSQSD